MKKRTKRPGRPSNRRAERTQAGDRTLVTRETTQAGIQNRIRTAVALPSLTASTTPCAVIHVSVAWVFFGNFATTRS